MSPRCRKVAVVGAGVAGLAAVKSCLEEGMEVVGYESRFCVGGLWSGTRDQWAQEGPAMYTSLITNTSKSMTCYSDFPCPADYPPYLPYPLYNEYLELYADHFQLKKHIQFNTRVLQITRADDHETTGAWFVTSEAQSGKRTRELFDGVMVCSGFFSRAWIPETPGLKDRFQGRVLHAKDYQDNSSFVGRTVLVVGNASSAVDIACDTSSVAKQVYMSVGQGCAVLPRVGQGALPSDLAIKRIYTVVLSPESIVGVFQSTAQKRFDHSKSGLLYTGQRSALCPIAVSDDLPPRILCGKVIIIPYVAEYQERAFTTTEGRTYTEIDDVIFATGYERDLSMLDESLGCGGDKLHLYKQVFPVEEKHHTLALIGCFRAIGPMPPTLELQARMAAYTLSGRHSLPARDVMRADVAKFNEMARRPDGSYKYSFLGLFIADAVASEIGVKPQFWKLVLSGRPALAWKCFFSSAYPFHYRLMGPGRWDGAEGAIDRALAENCKPLHNRSVTSQPPRSAGRGTTFRFMRNGIIVLTCLLTIGYLLGISKLFDLV